MNINETVLTHADCISSSDYESCDGDVEYRMPLSGSLVSHPRCDLHWGERLDLQHRLVSDYGIAFDPYAERYDSYDEDY